MATRVDPIRTTQTPDFHILQHNQVYRPTTYNVSPPSRWWTRTRSVLLHYINTILETHPQEGLLEELEMYPLRPQLGEEPQCIHHQVTLASSRPEHDVVLPTIQSGMTFQVLQVTQQRTQTQRPQTPRLNPHPEACQYTVVMRLSCPTSLSKHHHRRSFP